jgi:serine/threonine protein kinase
MIAWLTRLFRRAPRQPGEPQAHITFGATSAGRSFSRTRLLLKKQLWIWPIIAVVLLASVGYGIRVAIERTMQRSLQSELETLLQVERSMLETWLGVQEANGASLANDQQVRDVAAQILDAARVVDDVEEAAIEPAAVVPQGRALRALNARLAQELGPGMSAHHFVNYFLADKDFRILASSNPELMGKPVPQQYEAFVARTLAGDTTVSRPFPSTVSMKDEFGRVKTGVPTMHVCVPIRDAAFQIIAVLGLRIRPEREFTNILQLGRIGESGETYAINKNGTMVSNSRFDDDLILMGLLPDEENSHSLLNLQVRNPGGSLKDGYRPSVRRAELPLTKAAEVVATGTSGVDVAGYRGYRGDLVVGAWQWIPKYDMGVITEIDHAEAYRPLTILRWAFFSLLGLLILSSAAIFVFTLVVARLQREAQKAAIEARHLGQYRLDERIGAGGMGIVFKGHHAMLRRPTAIKLLNVEKVNETSIQRFEHEVQITCKLNHPNTVAIYDYGRTPEGVFYYAMEYLDGIDLEALVRKYGPQPEGRVIKILRQMCGSLYEAHSLGLVHRDIKPANAMLNRRGSEPDVVKVLDFGLVKALDNSRQTENAGGLAGTPLYMSPEAIQTPDLVDGRSDLYAVGAVGYFLLTGQPLFSANSLVELCHLQVEAVPDAPSKRLGRAISAELEGAIMACLEKSRAKRPQTARELATLLEQSPSANSWSLGEAEAWWGRHERTLAAAGATSSTTHNAATQTAPPTDNAAGSTSNSGFDQTMAHPGA